MDPGPVKVKKILPLTLVTYELCVVGEGRSLKGARCMEKKGVLKVNVNVKLITQRDGGALNFLSNSHI